MKRSFPSYFLPALLFLVISMELSACTFSLAEDITPPPGSQQPTQPQATQAFQIVYPVVPPDPAKGASIYAEKCAPCHGDIGMGDGPSAAQLSVPVPALGDPAVARQATPAEWFTMVTQGNVERFMPPFTSLSDRQRWDVVAYAFSLSAPASLVQQGKELYLAECADCHGQRGLGDGPKAAGLTKKPLSFADQSAMAERSEADFFAAISTGVGIDMPAFENQTNEAQRWALVDYLRSLTYASPGEVAESQPTPQVTSETPAPGEATPTQEATIGKVIVTIKNDSGIKTLEGLPVTLYVFDQMNLTFSTTVTSQADGTAIFDNQEFLSGRAFLAGIEYAGDTYGSEVGVSEDPTQPISLTVTIYDTTTDTSSLSVDRMHLFFDFTSADQLQVVELFVISNPTDKSITAAEKGQGVVTFALPEGATGLEFQDGALGGRYLEVPGGFADTATIQPGSGQYQVLFAYNLAYNRKLSFSLPMNLPVSQVTVFLPNNGIKAKSSVLQDMGTREVQGTQYLMFSGGNLEKGSQLSIDLSGRPKIGSSVITASNTRTDLIIGIGALGLTLVLVGFWLYRRNHNEEEAEDYDEDEESEEEDDQTPTDRDTLMDAIIALDELYQAGELPEEAYEQRRASLKEKLNRSLSQET